MKNHERELSEGVDLLSDDELDAVSGGDEVAHLPQSIHIDYGKLSIEQNPTRLSPDPEGAGSGPRLSADEEAVRPTHR